MIPQSSWRRWYDAVEETERAADRERSTTPTSRWLQERSPLASMVPQCAFNFRHFSIASVVADGRNIALLPLHWQRDSQVQTEAALQILSQGVAWGTRAPRPFVGMMLGGEVPLPRAISARSVLLEVLLGHHERLAEYLRVDGRGLAVLPPTLRDNTMLCWAACRAPSCLSGWPWVSHHLRDNFDFMRSVVREDPRAYRWASFRLKSSCLSLLEVAITSGNSMALHETYPPLRRRLSAARLAVVSAKRVCALPPEVRADRVSMLYLASIHEVQCARMGLGLCETQALREDALFQLELVRRAPCTISEVPLRWNVSFLRAALAENPWLIGEPGMEKVADFLGVLPQLEPKLKRYREGPAASEIDTIADQPPPKRARAVEELRCPICLETVKGRVLQCKNGHILCRGCADASPDGMHLCPVCRTRQTTEGLGRNLVAEFFAASLSSETS